MCVMYGVKRGKEITMCESVRELADALGLPASVISDDPEDNCLCNAKNAELNARRATDAEGWPFPQYIIEQPNTGNKPRGVATSA